jgi:hypothetical protein
MSINPKFHSIIAGRKREELFEIMFETRTALYFPIPFSSYSQPETGNIYITGDEEGVKSASNKLQSILKTVDSQVKSKKVTCSPRKMEWLYLNRKQQIRKIIYDNAVDIQFPAFNTNSNTIVFTGLKPNLIDRAIRSFKRLVLL